MATPIGTMFGNLKPGVVIYRYGSPTSLAVITDVDPSANEYRGKDIKVWIKKTGQEEWVSSSGWREFDSLITEHEKKLITHRTKRDEFVRAASDAGIPVI